MLHLEDNYLFMYKSVSDMRQFFRDSVTSKVTVVFVQSKQLFFEN